MNRNQNKARDVAITTSRGAFIARIVETSAGYGATVYGAVDSSDRVLAWMPFGLASFDDAVAWAEARARSEERRP